MSLAFHIFRSRGLLTLALLATVTHSAAAADLAWSRRTHLPAPKPEPVQQAAVTSPLSTNAERVAATQCRPGHSCIVCVANCDDTPPVVVADHRVVQTVPSSTGQQTENNADGYAAEAPGYARPMWAGIMCGQNSGCVAAGISAPPRPFEADIRITVINRYID